MKKWKEMERNRKKWKEWKEIERNGRQNKYQIKGKNFPQIQIFIDQQKYNIKIREKKIIEKKGKGK